MGPTFIDSEMVNFLELERSEKVSDTSASSPSLKTRKLIHVLNGLHIVHSLK